MAEYLIMDEVPFKPQAYERAARIIEELEEDLSEIYQKRGRRGLLEINGIGQNLADKIEEFIQTGKIKEYENLKKKCPVDLEQLTAVEGLGPKMIKALYEKLKIRNLDDLAQAVLAGKIAKLPRFGSKIQANILRSLDFIKSNQNRLLLSKALSLAQKIKEKLSSAPGVKKIVIAGSIRRQKETVGDMDFLAVADNPEKVIDYFCALPEVEKVLAQGKTKSMVRLFSGVEADLRVVKETSFGAAWQYFTGNKDHNIKLRKIAEEKGYKLNEYGLFLGKRMIAGKKEEEIYSKLGLPYIEAELREDTGEIEAAFQGKLPKLVRLKDIKGDLHLHSNWSDGANNFEEIAKAAKVLGYDYLAVTDHAGYLAIAGGLNEEELLKQIAEIEKINQKNIGLKILKGAEVDIKKDGTLAIANNILAKLDLVIVSVHDNFKMEKRLMTQRICRALSNPYVNILGHPSGRLIGRREGYLVDWEEIFAAAKKNQVALEINAYPERLDLAWQNVKKAVASGVKISLGTDAHSINQLEYMRLGVGVARRGWATKNDILNTMNLKNLIKFIKK